MSIEAISVLAAILFGLLTGYLGLRQLRSTTAADKQRAADALAAQIKDARDDERTRCAERIADVDRDLAEMTRDRDRAANQRDALQMLINQMRAGRDGGV